MTTPEPGHPADPQTSISMRLVLLLAFTCGAAAANLYYAQPLLHTIAGAFSVPTATAGLLVTSARVGYALGLAFVVPLGDLPERRRLIVVSIVMCGLGQAVAAIAPSFGVFALALCVVGVSSAVAQIIVPMSSSLAAEHERGSVVGTVMSGLLIGILTARTASGLLAGLLGWRGVFVIATATMLALAVRAARGAADRASDREAAPPDAAEFRRQPRPRGAATAPADGARRRVDGVLQHALDCDRVPALGTALQLRQHRDRPVRPGRDRGRADRPGHRPPRRPRPRHVRDVGRNGRTARELGLLVLGGHSVPILIVGIMLLDLGVQGIQISNQSAIYALRPDARSRLTTAYMVAYFAGGGSMSAAASALYASDGWNGVCVLGAIVATVGLVIWLATERPSPSSLRLGTASERG